MPGVGEGSSCQLGPALEVQRAGGTAYIPEVI